MSDLVGTSGVIYAAVFDARKHIAEVVAHFGFDVRVRDRILFRLRCAGSKQMSVPLKLSSIRISPGVIPAVAATVQKPLLPTCRPRDEDVKISSSTTACSRLRVQG